MFVRWKSDWRDTLSPTGLYIVGVNGGTPRLLVPGVNTSPDWSPDGRWIAFTRAMDGRLSVVSPNGDSLRPITSFSGSSPAWSPDGRELLFSTNHNDPSGASVLWIVPFDGSPPRDISQHGTGEWLHGDWSPDGQHIVHERFVTAVSGEELFVMDRDGGGGRRLTFNHVSDRDPAWSPRDSLIAWTQAEAVEIRVMRADGTGTRTLGAGSDPAWSPDGRVLVFARVISRGRRWARLLFTMAADGSGPRQITFD